MTLRKKIFLIVALTFFGLTIVSLITSYRILLGGIQEIEIRESRQDLDRAIALLDNELSSIGTMAREYATWNDMCTFMTSRTPAFITSNFTDSTFINLKINFIIITDRSGNIVYASGFDLKKQKKMPIFNGFPEQRKIIHDYIFSSPTSKSSSGIEFLQEGLTMLAVRPIMTSDGKGNPRGLFIIGRFLDTGEIAHLGEMLKLKLSLFHKNEKNLPPDVSNAWTALTPDQTMFIQPISGHTIAGYALMKDLFGKSSLVLRTMDDRSIFKHGKAIAVYVLIFVLFAALVFTVVSVLLLEKLVLRRLLKISHDVRSIESDGNLTKRIQLDGRDELANLTHDINNMLEKLEHSEINIRNEAEKYRAVIEDQTEFICRFDQDGALTFINDAYYRFFHHKRRELIGRHFLSFVPDNDRGHIDELLSSVKTENPVISYENRVILPEGEELWQHWTCRAIYDEHGEFMEYQAVGRDISDRKQAENELLTLNSKLEEANIQLGAAYTNMKNNLDKLRKHLFKEEFAFLVDRKGQICGITERVLEYMKLSRSEMIGANMSDYLPDKERETFIGELHEAWIGITKQSYVQLLRPKEESESQFFEMKLARLTLEGKRMLLVTLR
ncbi:MAG: PAS domain S-box protein [Deltaproteobacteria bacterium]|nr:PAS domain S-box protein [Deltaproteobacteria bacterium]